jgi:orotidine-5'-phosphate decarboxylase
VTESPLVLALDTDDLDRALGWAAAAGDAAGMVKVGLELFAAAGPAAVRALRDQGRRVMLDLKLHDIPATVAGAVRAAAAAGAELVTVHALGGPAMLAAAARAADGRCRLAAVTVLTSAGPAELAAAGLPPAAEAVPRLARLAVDAGCPALICSPLEAAALRADLGPTVELVCPGVRPAAGPTGTVAGDDQVRTATLAAAVRAGADRVVVGRPITLAADPAAAARAVRDEALAARQAAGR